MKRRRPPGRQVWFLDGETLLEGRDRSGCTVDGCHPNDLGFMRMGPKGGAASASDAGLPGGKYQPVWDIIRPANRVHLPFSFY